jgi:hypothetical protein
MDDRFFHVGLVVPDLAAAMHELSDALGSRWHEPHASRYGEWSITVTYSEQTGPPWLELISGSPGSPWDPAGGARMDHIGYWSGDLSADRCRLESAGVALEYDGTELGGKWLYLRASLAGLRIELLDIARQGYTYIPAT